MRAIHRFAAIACLLLIAAAGAAQQHPNQEKGFDPTKLYQFGDVDSINTFNGNLILTLPVSPVFRVSPALSYGFTAVFNSNVWDGYMVDGSTAEYFNTLPCQRCNAGLGWIVSLGRLLPPADPRNGTFKNGSFLYESPDGRDHRFDNEAFPWSPFGSVPPSYDAYSTDESRLHVHFDFGVATMYFPDGTTRTFTKAGTGADEHWNLTRIDDRFGNSVQIEIEDVPDSVHSDWKRETWTLVEYHGTTEVRRNILDWLITPDHSDRTDLSDPMGMGTTVKQTTLQSITTQSFGSATPNAVYKFNYTRKTLSRNHADTMGPTYKKNTVWGPDYNVLMLTSITLVSGEKYVMDYNTCTGHCLETGQITSLQLPAGGTYSYTYEPQGFPGPPRSTGGRTNNHILTPPETFRLESVAVKTRQLTDIDGSDKGTWSYRYAGSSPSPLSNCQDSGTSNEFWEAQTESVTTVTDPYGTTTAAYYSVYQDWDETRCMISKGWDFNEYGLPFIHWDDANGLHLSTEVYEGLTGFNRIDAEHPHVGDPAKLKRTTRVKYALVGDVMTRTYKETTSRTIFNDDPVLLSNGDKHWSETVRSDSDEMGHFRTTSTGGDFGDGPKYRTTFTHYPVVLGIPTDWMFETYSEQCSLMESSAHTADIAGCEALRGSATAKDFSWKQFCFKPTGFLARTRTIGDGRGSRSIEPGDGDLAVEYTPATTGDVAREDYYGGESLDQTSHETTQNTVNTGDLCTIQSLGTVAYSISHTYKTGTLETSQYANAGFLSVNRTIDEHTGLIASDTDPNGVTTTFGYDLAGRLKTADTPGLPETKYDYFAANFSGTPARAYVTVTQNGGTEGTKTSKFLFDGFGRVTRELSSTDDDTHPLRGHDTKYDNLGRKESETTADFYTDDNGPVPLKKTMLHYDWAGRTDVITAPDNTQTTFGYFGTRQTDRKVNVATAAGAATEAITTEIRDPLGRLISVKEPEAADPASYSYDVADHLIAVDMKGVDANNAVVTQHRQFDYDSRGFLLKETHPELGVTGDGSVDYLGYDARGHAKRKITGGSNNFDLTFDFDSAERLRHVYKTGVSDALKSFDYDRGRLIEAHRTNTVLINNVPKTVNVEEAYNYDAATGFLHDKSTTVWIDTAQVQKFTQGYGYDKFGNLKTLDYPSLMNGSAPARTITNLYRNGVLTGVDGYGSISYLGNGMIGSVVHKTATGNESQVDSQTSDNGMPRPATITFSGYCTGPSINQTEPANAMVLIDHTTQLTVSAPAGVATPTYAWYQVVNGVATAIAGANQPQFTTPALHETSYFYCLIGNGMCGTQSRTATVTVRTCDTIDITAQPQSVSVKSGTPWSFQVTANDSGAHYQWYEGLSGDTAHSVGTDSATLTITRTADTHFWVRVTSADHVCSIDSSTATLAMCVDVFISKQPVDVMVPYDGTSKGTAHVEVVGKAPFKYEWTIAGQLVTHANVATLSDDYQWTPPGVGTWTGSVKITDACGTETPQSRSFTLSAYDLSCQNWRILGLNYDAIEIPRSSMSRQVTVTVDPADTGSNGYHYHWFNSKDVAIGTDSSSIYLSANPFDYYYVKVTRDCKVGDTVVATPAQVSNKVYVWVAMSCPIMPVTINPPKALISAGGTAHFEAVTGWPIGIHYQWYHGQSGDTREPKATTPALDVDYHVTSYWVRITNDCGLTQDSPTATVEQTDPVACHPVFITQSPKSVESASGQSVTLSCDATSTPDPHSFDWYQGLDNLTPLTATSTGLKTVAPLETTTYWVRVGNGCTTADSDYATVHIVSCGTNQVVTQPADKDTKNTIPVTLSVTVSDPSQIASYQWYQGESGDTSHPVGSTTSTFTTPLLDADTKYWVRMTTTAGCKFDSHAAKVTVCVPPTLDLQPTNYNIQRGDGAWVTVRAHGTNLQYQWYVGVKGDTTNKILNATLPAFFTMPIDTTSYWCEVKNCETKQGETITVSVCPTIDAPPVAASLVVMSGGTTTLTATANGSSVVYQWYQGDPGDTSHPFGGNATTVTTPAITADTTFWVRAISGGCSVDSAPVQIHLCSQPSIGWTLLPPSIHPGDAVTLSVLVSPEGSAEVTFYEGQPGDTSHVVTVGPTYTQVTPAQTTTYWARAKMGNCWADTNALTVNVCIPKITQQPSGSMLINQSTPVQLTVTAQLATSYQWYAGTRGDTSNPVSGGTTATISVAPVADTHYWVRVQGSCAYTDSDEVIVTVCRPPDNLNYLGDYALTRGQSTSFSVAAATGTNLTFQWYVGTAPDTSAPIPQATSAYITVAPQNTTRYWCRVSNVCGTKDSNTTTVHVCVTPVIDAQPQSVTIFSGATATLTVSASEATAEPLHYNWIRVSDGQAAGTDSPSFTTPALSETTSYRVTVSAQGCTIDSDIATVSLCAYPATVNAPIGGQSHVGQPFGLTAVPNGGGNLYFFYQGASGDTSHPLSSTWTAVNTITVSPTVTTNYWYQLKNGSCTSNSGTGTVNVCIPTITSQPQSVMINSGQTATFSVVADTPGLTYQWYIGNSQQTGSPIAGATSATYTTPALTSNTNYWVLVMGSCGQGAASNTVTVSICQPPQITQTLQGAQWIARGSSGTVWVAATGTNLTYQWYTGTPGNTSAPVAGATAASVSVSPQNTTNYWCRVSGRCAPPADSVAITVQVCASPVITAQPQGVSIFSGQNATLSVTATEATTSPVQYQWYQGASGNTNTPISGATSSSYTTPALYGNTDYWVRISCGTCGPADSQTATVAICPYPAVVTGPADAYIASGQTTRLTTIPQSGSNSYRFYRGASGDTTNPITNWQTTNYVDVAPTVTTQYWAQVSTGTCITRITTTTVNVCIPTITTQPASLMINPGASTTLTVAATPSGMTYQWYVGTSGTTTTPISGATGTSVTVSPSSTTNYWVKVSGSCNQSVNSNAATVSVCQVPTVTVITPSPAISRGSSTTLSVNASGTNITYQWYLGTTGNTATPIPGATAASVLVGPNDNTNYWCRVTGTCGTRDSATITVSVCTNPSITAQPQSVTIFSGSSTTLSVAASEGASTPMTYQWYVGTSGSTASPISGATSTSYTTPALTSPTNYWVRVSCGVCTPADSATATVSICTYAQSVAGPGDAQVTVGQTVRLFGVPAASGNTYRWYTGASGNTSSPIGGWSSSNFIDVSPTVTTSYWYQVSNGTCVSNSAAGTLYVCVPTFTQQPQSTTVPAGTQVTITAAANTAGVTYQWYTGTSGNTASPISGATGTSITVAPTTTTSYWVRAWSTCSRGTDSATATVTICGMPVISRQPYNPTPINPGWSASTDVIASGATSYQWYRGESGDMSSPISGATGSSVAVGTFSSLRVWVRVTNACGSTNSNAAWISVYPTISSQPQGGTHLNAGSTVMLTVGATGTSLHYGWRLNGNSVGTDSPTAIIQIDQDNSGVTCDVTSGIATSHSDIAYFYTCGSGMYITGIQTYPQPNGCKTLGVSVSQPQWVSSTDWYQGPRGDTSHPVTSWPLCPTSSTQYWARVNSWDDSMQTSCYTDSTTVTLP